MKKIVVFCIVGCLFSLIPVQSITVGQKIDFDPVVTTNYRVPAEEINVLIIESIQDGRGLTIIIKNIGEKPVTDGVLCAEVIEGPNMLFLKKKTSIPPLSPGETTSVTLHPFGFSRGLFRPYPMITFSFKGENMLHLEWGIITKVVGLKFEILGSYFDSVFSSEGYTLFAPEYSTKTYLIENGGDIVHEWESEYFQALGVYLNEEGCLVRTGLSENTPLFWGGGLGGRIEIIDWNNTVIWEYTYANDTVCQHHDIEVMPNGNILLIAWEYKSTEEAIAAGRNPLFIPEDQLWADHIVEVKPTGPNQGEIVWEWHIWDHLIQDYDPTKDNYGVVADHPELIDINFVDPPYYGQKDFTHVNTVSYNEHYDQIMISIHNFNEIWVIDHSTTTKEAAGHTGGRYGKGGDLLYRWGNPEAYDRGGPRDQLLYGQHDAQWIEPGSPGQGHILIFNNGLFRPQGNFSSVVEIIPPVLPDGSYFLSPQGRYGPEKVFWEFSGKDSSFEFYSSIISGAQRLPNGNTLICHGVGGVFFEVSYFGDLVWAYTNQFPSFFTNHVFKIRRYAPDYPGLTQLFE